MVESSNPQTIRFLAAIYAWNLKKAQMIMGKSASRLHGLPPTQAAASERLRNLPYHYWDDFDGDLLLAYGNTIPKFKIEVDMLIIYKGDGDTELIRHTFDFCNHVTYYNINKLFLQLRVFCGAPYYIVGNYLNFYSHVHRCTFIVIKKFVIIE